MLGRKWFTRRQIPPRNDALLAAMRLGQQSSDPDRAPLFRELVAANLIVPLYQPPPGEESGATGRPVYAALEREGSRALAGFTDLDALRRFYPGQIPWMAVPAITLCQQALYGGFDHVLINPSGPIGYEMSRSEIQTLAEGLLPVGEHRVMVAAETQVQIGMPAVRPPEAMLAAMRAAVAQSGVREVYWFWMAVAGSQPHLGLGIDPPKGETAGLVGRAVEGIWKKYRPDNPLIDVIGLDETGTSQVIRQRGELLYREGE